MLFHMRVGAQRERFKDAKISDAVVATVYPDLGALIYSPCGYVCVYVCVFAFCFWTSLTPSLPRYEDFKGSTHLSLSTRLTNRSRDMDQHSLPYRVNHSRQYLLFFYCHALSHIFNDGKNLYFFMRNSKCTYTYGESNPRMFDAMVSVLPSDLGGAGGEGVGMGQASIHPRRAETTSLTHIRLFFCVRQVGRNAYAQVSPAVVATVESSLAPQLLDLIRWICSADIPFRTQNHRQQGARYEGEKQRKKKSRDIIGRMCS